MLFYLILRYLACNEPKKLSSTVVAEAQGIKFKSLIILFLLPRMRSMSGVKVIGTDVHIYVCVFVDEKKFELYFSDRLTFSNIRSRTSRFTFGDT